MKTTLPYLLLATALTGAASATPNANPDGLTIGLSTNQAGLYPSGFGMEFASYLGGTLIYSGVSSDVANDFDAGVTTYGNPVNIVLGSDDLGSGMNEGVFSVFSANNFLYEGSTNPLFKIESPTNIATFDDVDVVIKDGTLTVGTSPVLTQASSPAFLGGLTPPTTSSWTNTYLSRGNTANGGAFAFGTTTLASGEASVAIGNVAQAGDTFSFAHGKTVNASAIYSRATGSDSQATSNYATAHGNNAMATAWYAYANGLNTTAKTAYEVVFGRNNIESPTPGGAGVFSGDHGLFRLGNGSSTARSDAMTVLKSGQTTLTNKEWKAAYTATPTTATALANPASGTDSDGNALVVDGHTILNGKVVISVPQGDLSMGSFTAP